MNLTRTRDLTYSWIEYARILRRCMVNMREGVPGAETALQRWAAQAVDKGKLDPS